MTRTRVIVLVVFVAAFAAGVATGLVLRPAHPRPPERGPSWLVAELSLTPAQQEEMLKIWGNVGRSGWQEENEKRQALQKQRDEAIRNLVPKAAQAEFDKANETYAKRSAELGELRRQRFDAAVAKTKAILTDEQRAKYETILARRAEGRGEGRRFGPGPGPGWDRSGGGPTTRPATATAAATAPAATEPAAVMQPPAPTDTPIPSGDPSR